MVNIIQSILVAGGTIASSFIAALYVFQEKLLYHPNLPTREYERQPDDLSMRYSDVDVITEDGIRLHAWLILQPDSQNASTFLYFHGNAGNISHRLPDARQFYTSGFNLLMVSYRGYGSSEGSPSEIGFSKDAAAALAYARDRSDVLDTSRLFLFGRSIGGACTISAATSADAQNALRGIVVENTFTSINDMIDKVIPALRFAKPLNRNNWDSLKRIRSIRLPIMFISGLRDELCPPEHMRILYLNAVAAKFKVMHTVADGQHNDTWWRGGSHYRQAIRDFVARANAEG